MKTCQSCGHRPAVVEFIQVSGDERREMSLCRECALSVGMRAQVEAFQRLSQLLMQQGNPAVPEDARALLQTKCSRCDTIFEEFVQTGLLGCPQCYHDFHELLHPLLRRMHGVTRQIGSEGAESTHKTPESSPEAAADPTAAPDDTREQIEVALHLALLEENYERAAVLRDQLHKL